MGKHAYLIVAHKNDFTFNTLLELLDDPRNTLFIHMDKKNRQYNPEDTIKLLLRAKVCHTPVRNDVRWGGYSMIATELLLLQTATSYGTFDYYHLISGEDLPIKTQDFIHGFFDSKPDKVFVSMAESFRNEERVCYYYPFNQWIRGENSMLASLQWVFYEVQKLLGIRRNKGIQFREGDQWFSVSDAFARYTLSKAKWIHRVFRSTVCADEIFIQTVLWNSSYGNQLYSSKDADEPNGIVRFIDWTRTDGKHPWIFRMEDIQLLTDSPNLFARKFDCRVDQEIISYVAEKLAKGN